MILLAQRGYKDGRLEFQVQDTYIIHWARSLQLKWWQRGKGGGIGHSPRQAVMKKKFFITSPAGGYAEIFLMEKNFGIASGRTSDEL